MDDGSHDEDYRYLDESSHPTPPSRPPTAPPLPLPPAPGPGPSPLASPSLVPQRTSSASPYPFHSNPYDQQPSQQLIQQQQAQLLQQQQQAYAFAQHSPFAPPPLIPQTTIPPAMMHHSPSSMYTTMQMPRRSSDDQLGSMAEVGGSGDGHKSKRKRASLPSGLSGRYGFASGEGGGSGAKARSATMDQVGTVESPGQFDEGTDEEGQQSGSGRSKGKRSTSAGGSTTNPGLTSCEACRKGKRRCEPSPLVPPSHPDAAKLPCARCRRFALECVRVKVVRRKGPAPVDLSAISDAVHGFPHDGSSAPNTAGGDMYASTSGSGPNSVPDLLRRTSSNLQNGMLDQGQTSRRPSASPQYPLLSASPSTSMQDLPSNLDQVVAGPVIDNIIGLFFDYVYPLTPCLHRPTFVSKLTARLDRTDPIFFALTLVVLASTLVQVPRNLVNLEKDEVEALARRCVRVARAKIAFIWEEPTPIQSELITICYLEGIVHLLLGNNTAHVIVTAQANQLALAMRLNEESSYDHLDPIECEIRRRIYWLLFQADKSTACTRARAICLRLDDAPALRLPTEVDDEQITLQGIMPQPQGRTSIITGFNIVTNLFRILNDALLLQRRKAPPTVDSILADLRNVNELREKVMTTTMDVASPLQLRNAYDSRVTSPAQDWEVKLQARFLDFFHSSDPDAHAHALNSFLVMQGNILVTQHVVRLVLLQTKDSLLQQLSMITQLPVSGLGAITGSAGGALVDELAEDIAVGLLDGLNSLPVECVATNGPSLVQKVRFVAIQLMECSTSPSATTARAQKLLMQFLSVLSVIEGMYTFGKDISAE